MIWKPQFGVQLNRSHPLAQGLKTACLFNEYSGLSVYDLASNNTLSGALSWDGAGGDFDGTSDYIEIPINYDLDWQASDCTMFVVFNGTPGDNVFRYAVCAYNSSITYSHIGLGQIDYDPYGRALARVGRQYTANAGSVYSPTTATGAKTIAGTYTSTDIRLFVDGVLTGTPGATSTYGTTGLDRLRIGGGIYYNNVNYWSGGLEAVYVFNRKLSAYEIGLLHFNPYQIFEPIFIPSVVGSSGASAAITGTIASAVESDIVNGGETIILTLTGDTWVATVGADNAITTALISGIDSAQSETAGWDAEVKANMTYAEIVRTSDTVVTITLTAKADYEITADETITITIPATALTLGEAIVCDSFTITNESPGTSISIFMHHYRMMAGA